ncbi:hypothetical protein IM40_10335 (plasmid) [Candidatus Paracaedimonas acanthamoebae]|nr:hypothetical protein IM40_10335 [Candidatus Paracaedimonas acanthamoebae]
MRFYEAAGGVQDLSRMLVSVLSGMALDHEEVKDITTDPSLQSLLLALGLTEKDELRLVDSDDFQLKPLYSAILAHSQRLGLSALDWVKNHPMEFFDGFCTLANIASFVPVPAIAIPGNIGNRICLVGKAAIYLPKFQQ